MRQDYGKSLAGIYIIHVLASNIGTYVPVQILYFLSNQMIFFSNTFNDFLDWIQLVKKKRIILIDTQVFSNYK